MSFISPRTLAVFVTTLIFLVSNMSIENDQRIADTLIQFFHAMVKVCAGNFIDLSQAVGRACPSLLLEGEMRLMLSITFVIQFRQPHKCS